MILDNELFQQLPLFLADGSDGIYLPTRGNKQELGKGSPASVQTAGSLLPLTRGGSISWGLHRTFVCDPPTPVYFS